jgi:ribonuclease P protein subunit RPR2
MAKTKEPKVPKRVPNKHLHARVSYLYQAASFLSLRNEPDSQDQKETKETRESEASNAILASAETSSGQEIKDTKHAALSASSQIPQSSLALFLGSQLRSVSQKSQIRLSHDLKRSLCKSCNALLIPGQSSSTKIENKSKNGKKPWADVLLIECQTCGAIKRFPVGSKRQERKAERVKPKLDSVKAIEHDTSSGDVMDIDQSKG